MNVTSFLLSALVAFSPLDAADESKRRVTAFFSGSQNQVRARAAAFDFNGTYRLNARRSDKLYSVFSSAAAKLPIREQQRVFDDLSVRLSSPDQLAIERRGDIFLIASSRAAQTRIDASRNNQTAGTRATISDTKLEVTTRGKDGNTDRFYVAFELIDDGNALRVTRRITAEGISEPIVVTSVYERISEVPRWSIYVEGTRPPRATQPEAARTVGVSTATNNAGAVTNNSANNSLPPQARVLHNRLDALIAATNANDIEKQSAYYAARLTRYYLASDVAREAVRAELVRVFKDADLIDIRAADPEIIFAPDGQTAVMRFRKQYRVRKRGALRHGEVVQELRWQLIDGAWKIISERDIQVIRR